MKRFTGTASELIENLKNENRECKRLRLSDEYSERIYLDNGDECENYGTNLNTDGDQTEFSDAGDSPCSSANPPEDCILVTVSDESNQMFNEQDSIGNYLNDTNEEDLDPGDHSLILEGGISQIPSDSYLIYNEHVSNGIDQDLSMCPNVSSFENSGGPSTSSLVESKSGDSCIEEQPSAYTSEISKISFKWDVENLPTSLLQATSLEGHSDDVLCVAVDGNIVISASADTSVKVWNASDQNLLCSFRGHTAAVTSVVLLSPEQTNVLSGKIMLKNVSNIVVTCSLDCTCRLWSLPEGKEISSFYTFNGITCVKYLEKELCVIIGTDGGKLELWELCSSTLVHSVFAHEDLISDICIDMSYTYTVSVDGMVKVWLVEKKCLQLLYTRRRKESSDHIHFSPCLWKAVSSFQNNLYLGDNSSHLKILDWRSGKLKILQNEMFLIGEVDALCIYKNMLLCSFYNTETLNAAVHVWQLPELKYVCTLQGSVQRIFSLVVTEMEGALRIVSAGSQLITWDFDFSQPPSAKNESPFYCTSLEQANVDVPIETNGGISSPRAEVIPALGSVRNTAWGCNLL